MILKYDMNGYQKVSLFERNQTKSTIINVENRKVLHFLKTIATIIIIHTYSILEFRHR